MDLRNLDFGKLFFRLALLVLVFVVGMGVGRYQWFPFSFIQFGKDSVLQVFHDRYTILGIRPEGLLMPARYEGNGVTVHRPEQTAPGLTLLVSFFEDNNEIRLVRLDGSSVARWPVRFSEIYPDPSHIEPPWMVPQSDWNVEIHGVVALPDGGVVFNFAEIGMVKLDRCGTLEWTLPRMTHHSIDRAEEGGYWVPGRTWVPEGAETLHPLIGAPYYEESLMHVSETGSVLQEISLSGLFVKNDLLAVLFANGLIGARFPTFPDQGEDFTHLNDIEELKSDMQDSFPMFSPGDLLLSLRDLNLLMVVDPATEVVKWHQTGPWLSQHDPDFRDDGVISVLSNNDDRTPDGSILGGSTILELMPASGEVTTRYPVTADQHWYTQYRGKHQYLENGNLLITETGAGRAFEVDPEGNTVWEYVNRFDEDRVALLFDAIRYPETYFTVETWACP